MPAALGPDHPERSRFCGGRTLIADCAVRNAV